MNNSSDDDAGSLLRRFQALAAKTYAHEAKEDRITAIYNPGSENLLDLHANVASIDSLMSAAATTLRDPSAFQVYHLGSKPHVKGIADAHIESFVDQIYQEGRAYAKALGGPALIAAKIDSTRYPEDAALAAKGGEAGIDAIARHHVAQAFDLLSKQSNLESLREFGAKDQASLETVRQGIAAEMNRLGLNGLGPMLDANPAIGAEIAKDATGIVVPFAKGQSVEGVPVLSHVTRAAYLHSEEQFVEEKLASGQMDRTRADAYLHQAKHFALGQDYAKAMAENERLVKEQSGEAYKFASALAKPTSAYLDELADPALNAIQHHDAEKWIMIKHGIALHDPAAKDFAAGLQEHMSQARMSRTGAHPSSVLEETDIKKKLPGAAESGSTKNGPPNISDIASANDPAAEKIAGAKLEAESGLSSEGKFASRFTKISPRSKIALVGGTMAVGFLGLVGYEHMKTKNQPSKTVIAR